MPVAFDDSEFAFRKRLITVGFMHHAPRKKCEHAYADCRGDYAQYRPHAENSRNVSHLTTNSELTGFLGAQRIKIPCESTCQQII